MNDKPLKVLAADDEYWIRENLRTIIDWQALGLELLPMAQDGEDALRKMEESPADIVITDINMPYISGVELMEQLKSRWPETAILVLSGYSDFEYVHKALLCGALDYVLKPLNRSKLMEALSRAIEQVLAKTRRQRERSEEQARLNLAASMVLDREFSQWLHDARRQDLLQSVEAKLYDYEAAFSSYRVVLVRLPGFMQHLGEGELPASAAEAVYKIKTALASWIRTGNKLVIHDLYHANHFLIITETDEQELRRMLQAALTEIGALSGVAPRALVSEGYFSFRDLRKAYDQTRRCIVSMLCSAGMKIGYAAELREAPVIQRIGTDMVRQLEQAARAQQRERFERLLDQSGIYRCCEENWTVQELMHSVNCITWILQNLTEDHRSGEQRAALDNLQELLLSTVESMQLDQLRSLFSQMMDEYFGSGSSEAGSESMRSTVQRVKVYIDAHYDEEISLGTLAQRFSVDDSYLSRMFKQQVGCNLMLYLASARIAQAKRLLVQKNLNITDVAQLVGYDDYAYFSRVFKRIEGKSPRAYREEEVR